jgi:hypothetical protein
MKPTCIVLIAVLALQAGPIIPQNEKACGDKIYEDHNQVDPKPLKLAKLQGRGVIEIRGQVKPNETVPGACLSLFANDRQLVASVKADSNGEFSFANVAPGHYRLLARAPGFCTANIRVEIVNTSRRNKLQRNEIVVHYRVSEMDSCSWGALGQK